VLVQVVEEIEGSDEMGSEEDDDEDDGTEGFEADEAAQNDDGEEAEEAEEDDDDDESDVGIRPRFHPPQPKTDAILVGLYLTLAPV